MIDFITGTFDSMKRTNFPLLATMMVRDMSVPTISTDLQQVDPPVAVDDSVITHRRLRAHLFSVKILIRYILMPMLVRGFAHTAPALAFHLAETELKIIEHTHHFF